MFTNSKLSCKDTTRSKYWNYTVLLYIKYSVAFCFSSRCIYQTAQPIHWVNLASHELCMRNPANV